VMRPAVYLLMRQLPLTTTGKVDRKALPSVGDKLELVAGTAEVVEDSLGRLRRIRTHAEAVYQNSMLTVLCLNCIGILLCHWLPADSTWALPDVSLGVRTFITFMQQASNFNFLALFVALGYRTRRQSDADTRDDIIALILILVVLGWPYWFPWAAGIATFQRYTCVTMLASHIVLLIFRCARIPPWGQLMAVILGALATGPRAVMMPGIPEGAGATSIFKHPALLIFESQFFGSWGLQFTIVFLFLLGYHGATLAEGYLQRYAAATSPSMRSCLRILSGLIFLGLVWIPVSGATESLASTRNNMYMSWDVMGGDAYKMSVYPLNLCRWMVTIFAMLFAFADGNWMMHRLGRNFMGVYLVHMYFSLDLLSVIRQGEPYGPPFQVAAIVGVPILYTLSVGAIAQDLIAACFRELLRLQGLAVSRFQK